MKKTIVFCWIYPLNVTNGGIERVTRRLMDGLSKRGYKCLFVLHDIENNRFVHNEEEISNLNVFLSKRNVDTLVNQNGYSSQISETLDGAKWQGRYIVCHHNEPLYLRKVYDLSRVIDEFLAPKNTSIIRLSWLARLLSYPIWQKLSVKKIAKTQERNYRCAHHYVLLSSAFMPQLSRLIGRPEIPKAVAIPNPLSFEIKSGEVDTFVKKNEVLIVARLNDGEKRISMALKAWQEIEAKGPDGWMLKIIGYGPDAQALEKKAYEMGLKRVVFLGHQEPLPHYRTASIFLMTSRIEGWGLTLTEAMQSGAVPIAFDAYASLRDIVDDGKTGIIVPNGNVRAFATSAINLMRDPERRQSLAENAVIAVQRFRLDSVLDQWEAIL